MEACTECGMHVIPSEFHPYAACLMFKGCHDSETVRANLKALNTRPTPEAITDIVWTGKCRCIIDAINNINELAAATDAWKGCDKCNNTGTITRPATLEEVGEFQANAIKLILEGNEVSKEALTVNGGTLSIKEGM